MTTGPIQRGKKTITYETNTIPKVSVRGRVGYRWISEWFSFGPYFALAYSELVERGSDAAGGLRAVSGFDSQLGLGITVAF